MSAPIDLVRADLRDFAGYRSARSDRLVGDVWLNANESAWPNVADDANIVRRYPDPQPEALRTRLATLYGCRPDQLIAGRGSDEAIDLLVRALCMPGQGAIVTTPPTFGMYAVSARLQGARVVEVPLIDDGANFHCDVDAVADAALASRATLVFLCSPGNPTGGAVPLDDVRRLAARLEGRALVVVDEAYQEFAPTPSAVSLLATCPNIVVLRTLSKAHALAGVRLGVAIGDADLIVVLRRCQAPYPLPAPCVALVERALGDGPLSRTEARTRECFGERARLADALRDAPGVRRVYPSVANFLLVRFDDAQVAFDALLSAGVVVRDVRAQPGLDDALRITVGRPDENDRVIAVLAGVFA
ncbi:histidinol-phosphate transaminase [Lysobacter sp. TY2-98]|uniref:histidinol-phosphate transaminase n=1 Tax=Lysobacter sp. TY2-98 TaxID=2290922 RepID=UPI000E20A3D2|nr:histidinol-phosphate transaminase [Lysobacter sp. TY2-98]AXK72234.1 histidinol-phosphate transaminase [Lysobacter sp. TY2-98]